MYQDSAGVCHLRELSKAGLTHVHLLPCFHFAGVDDVKDNWKSVGRLKTFVSLLLVFFTVQHNLHNKFLS